MDLYLSLRHLINSEKTPIKIIQGVRYDDLGSELRDYPLHHARRAFDEATLQGDDPFPVPREASLSCVLRKCAAQAEPDRRIGCERMTEQVRCLPRYFTAQTGSLAAHHHDLLCCLDTGVVFTHGADIPRFLYPHRFI